MGQNGQIEGSGEIPHLANGLFTQGASEKVKRGCDEAQQHGVLPQFSGKINHRWGERNQDQADHAGRLRKISLHPFERSPAKGGPGKHRG